MALLLNLAGVSQIQQIEIDITQLSNELSQATLTESIQTRSATTTINLPYINNSKLACYVFENRIMSGHLRNQHPGINTYTFRAVENAEIFGRATLSSSGFYCTFFTDSTLISINPADRSNPSLYQIEIGVQDEEDFTCSTSSNTENRRSAAPPTDAPESLGDNPLSLTNQEGLVIKRTYDLVVGATGQFTLANGGTAESAMSTLLQTVNVLDALYRKELSVGFNLVATCIRTNPLTDEFIPVVDGDDCRTGQAASFIEDCANTEYDIGHVFHNISSFFDGGEPGWDDGGVAGLGVVCSNSTNNCGGYTGERKGAGWSGSYNNTRNSWYYLAAHEFGHQFGAEHTWSGKGRSCSNDNFSVLNAVEIGAGITIMSYSNLCNSRWNYGSRQGYFSGWSLAQMMDYANNRLCATDVQSSNSTPQVNPCNVNNFSIPIGTPFKLTGNVTDQDDGELQYNWEQVDNDAGDARSRGATLNQVGSNGLTAGFSDTGPLFRSYNYSNSPTRYFPNLSNYTGNVNTVGTEFEVLPQVERQINFVLTARDCNDEVGGVAQDLFVVNSQNVGPLVVNDICGNEALVAGNTYNLTWNTNGSDNLCNNVNVMMSVDGGFTFPYALAENVNYSSQEVNISLPAGLLATERARFMVLCADSDCATFFAVNENNCAITSNCVAVETQISDTQLLEVALNSPELNLQLQNNLSSPKTNFSGTLTDSDITSTLAFFVDCEDEICSTLLFTNNNIDIYNFSVDLDDVYTFTLNSDSNQIINIYKRPYFFAGCSNHLTSSAKRNVGFCPGTGEPVTTTSTATIELNRFDSYGLVFSSFSTPVDYTISISSDSGGQVYEGSLINPSGYSYTYLAVNQNTNQISLINANANFTDLTVGCYNIYGLNYEENENPNSFIGKTINEVLFSSCVATSWNFKPVCIIANPIMGCTNSNACNYNPDANIDDDTCLLTGTACDDNKNCTEDDVIQNDCSCSGTIIDENQNNICDLYEADNVASVPTMSQWGLFILSLLLLNLVFVRLLVGQQQLFNTQNKAVAAFNWFSIKSYPFDAGLYLKAVKTSLILLPAIVLLIFLIYQKLVWADFIGLSITIPVLSYC